MILKSEIFMKFDVLPAPVCVLPGTVWYCLERLQQQTWKLSAWDTDRETNGWMFRWLPSLFSELETELKKYQKQVVLWVTL